MLCRISGFLYTALGSVVKAGEVTLRLQQDIISPDGTKVVPTSITQSLAPLDPPSDLTAVPIGGSGSTSYSYWVVAVDGNGGVSSLGDPVTLATSQAVLNGSTYNRLSWAAVPGAKSYQVFGRSSPTPTLLGTTTALTYDDKGVTVGTSHPGENTSGGYLDVTVQATVGATPAGVAYFVEFDPDPSDTSTPPKQKDGYWSNYWSVPNVSSVPLANFTSAVRGAPYANYMPLGGVLSQTADTLIIGAAPANTTKRILANQATTQPGMRYNAATNEWELSNDGSTYEAIVTSSDLASGGFGTVNGPATSTNNAVALFNGTSGALLKDSATTLDTDGTLAANSDSRLATQKAIKTYVDGAVGGVGTGVTVYDNSISSPPSAPQTGDLWLPSDSALLYRRSSSGWHASGPLQKIGVPTDAGLNTWVNQGTSTIATTNNVLCLTGQRSGSTGTTQLRGYVKSVSDSDFTLIVGMLPLLSHIGNRSDGGLMVRNSASGKIATIGWCYSSLYTATLQPNTYPAATSAPSNATSWSFPIPQITWLRCVYTASTQTTAFAVSFDKVNWYTVASNTYTVGVDQVGIFTACYLSTFDAMLSIVSWELS